MSKIDWSTRFKEADQAQQSLRSAFSRWYDSFYAVYTENVAPWRSKVVDPKVASKCKAVIAKLSLSEPTPNLIPNDDHDFLKARNNEVLLKNDLNNPLFEQSIYLKKNSILTDAGVTGTGLALVPWKYCKKTYFSRVVDKNGKVDLEKEKKKEVKVGYNELEPISVFRIFIDPEASSLNDARWVIIQDFKDIEDLKAMSDTSKGYKNLDKIVQASPQNTITRQLESSRNRLLSQLSSGGDKCEIWHCWDRIKGTYEIVANGGALVIKEDKNYYWHGKFPIVSFYIKPRAHSFWGEGLFEATERLDSANNSLMNHFFDQLDLSINSFLIRQSGTQIVSYDMSPGGEIVYTGNEKPEFSAIPQPDVQGFQLARQMLSESIEENTISQYELGTPRSATDKTQGTATGIQEVRDAASDIIRSFEMAWSSSWKEVFAIWMSNNQQFMDRERAIRILGPNGYYPKLIKPEDIITAGQLDIEVDVDAMRPRSKEADRALTIAYIDKQLEIYKLSQQDAQISGKAPLSINFFELSRVFADAMGQKAFDRIIEPTNIASDSPTTENTIILQGKDVEALEQDDHETHIAIHQELIEDEGIDDEVRLITEAHIQHHQMIMEQMKQQQQQAEIEQLKQMEMQTAQEAGIPTPGFAMNQQINQGNAVQNQAPMANANIAQGQGGIPSRMV